MKKVYTLFLIIFTLITCTGDHLKFHHDLFVADAHNDVMLRVMRGEDISSRTPGGHTDIPRLKEGGIDLQVFVMWIDPEQYLPFGSFDRANAMIDALYTIEFKLPEQISISKSYEDLLRNERDGKIAAVIGVEGGHAIENSLTITSLNFH